MANEDDYRSSEDTPEDIKSSKWYNQSDLNIDKYYTRFQKRYDKKTEP
jgi:hypothetical protein